MRLFPALLAMALVLTALPAVSAGGPVARCFGLEGGPRVCDGHHEYGDPEECEENHDSFNTHMEISAIWVELDDSTSIHQSTFENCLRADRIGVDREYYSATVWLEQDGDETILLDYTYQRDHDVEQCSVTAAEQTLDVDPDACLVTEDVHLHDLLP